MFIERKLSSKVLKKLNNNPVVAILGPRQSGKSTLAKKVILPMKNSIYLDLERSSDLNKLQDTEAFFLSNTNKLICIDEIQRKPDIFPVIRSIVDEGNRNGRFLILGSASPDLIRQSSESLAGRIAYLELTPFLFEELLNYNKNSKLRDLWLKGGFPRSYLAGDETESYEWRENFIKTFLERDIPQLGFKVPSKHIERFWMMCAHIHGEILNRSKLGESLGVSHHTVQSYIDILENTYMLRVVRPYETNLKKRLIKSPKIYLRDSGLLHSLLQIVNTNDLFGHPVYGSSWEGFALENILSSISIWKSYFYRDSNGTEIDLILEKANKRIAIEFKVSSSPTITKKFYNAINTIKAAETWIVAPVNDTYQIKPNIFVTSLYELIKHLRSNHYYQ